jgi:hypothetical protein
MVLLQDGQVMEIATEHPNARQAEACDVADGGLPSALDRRIARTGQDESVRIGSHPGTPRPRPRPYYNKP